MKCLSRSLFLLLAVLLAAAHADAAESHTSKAPETPEIYDLNIEDLLDVKVTAAARQRQSIYDSPGITSIITRQEIDSYGGLTLGEILDRATSVYLMGTVDSANGVISMRGDTADRYNNHILFMLNGRPLRESLYGGYTADILTAFPVDSIWQIEVTRGPGSILYGTNAMIGVINIITAPLKDEASQPEGKASVTYGSFNTKRASGAFYEKFGKVEASGGLLYSTHDGWAFRATDGGAAFGQTPTTRTLPLFDNALGATAHLSLEKWTLNTYFNQNERPIAFGSPNYPLWSTGAQRKTSRAMMDLGREFNPADQWKSTLNLSYSLFSDRTTANTPNTYVGTGSAQRIQTDWVNRLGLSQDLSLTLAGSYFYETGGIDSNGSSTDTTAAFTRHNGRLSGQADYQFDFVRLFAGGQINKIDKLPIYFSPRVGTIATFSENLGLKILYSMAMRAPSPAEQNYNLDVRMANGSNQVFQVGNPSLIPEDVHTLDFQMFFATPSIYVSATYFVTSKHEAIVESSTSPGAFINSPKNIEAQGMEMESKFHLNTQWSLVNNLTLQDYAENGDHTFAYLPTVLGKFGANYKPAQGYSFGIFDSYFGNSEAVQSTVSPNPAVRPYHYVSAQADFDIKQIFRLNRLPNLSLQVYGTNLLDSVVYYPEYNFGAINSFPGRAGRSLYLSLTVRF